MSEARTKKRAFCCGRNSGKTCIGNPQFPNEKGDRCKSFRCSRCKSTVGWCKGGAHDLLPDGSQHPADNWCDDCYVEVYCTGEYDVPPETPRHQRDRSLPERPRTWAAALAQVKKRP